MWSSFLEALRGHPRLVAIVSIVVLASGSLAAGLAVGTWQTVCSDCPSIAQIWVWEPKQSTKILAHDGQVITELFQERRTPVALEDLPAHVAQAFIAVEDKRFYEHNGFDFLGIARGLSGILLKGRITGGGSTITQQLARNMFVEKVGFERRWTRKLKEAKVARELERVYSKQQILTAYINVINFDHGWYGIETAAQRYFGKGAAEVNPAEAALLAAIINRPGAYSPFRNPERALRRRNLVLSLMADQGYLSEQDAERWKEEPIPQEPHGGEEGELAPYFVEWVRRSLDDRYGSDLYRRGFRVYTTLDLDMQRRAREAMEKGWARIEEQRGYRHPKYASVLAQKGAGTQDGETPYLQGMFVALEPGTGEIRAMIGGRDFDHSKFNRATQARRQPGSTFKPFVYASAIASGIPASHSIHDAPLMLTQPDGSTWAPRNFDRDFAGPITLRYALMKSINTVAVKLALEVGLETVIQTAGRMGVETELPRVPSVAIGSGEVIPIQIAEAYGVFANQGIRARAHSVLRVEDADGRVLWQARPDQERVLEPLPAAITTSLLRSVVDGGTGYTPIRGSGALPYDVPAAGKTGTTNDATDVWFIGFTPELLAAVWFGFDTPKRILPGATGGGYAAPVWAEFMRSVYLGDTALRPIPAPWPMPAELVTRRVDKKTGKLAAEWCPQDNTYTEYYVPGSEPTEACDVDSRGLFGAPIRGLFPAPLDTVPADTMGAALPAPGTGGDTAARRAPALDVAPGDTTQRTIFFRPDTTSRRPTRDAGGRTR